jgi:hypothetical protein
MVEAARTLSEVPQAMQLRYLGTLFDIAGERGSTIVFPFPIELANLFSTRRGRDRKPPPPAHGAGKSTGQIAKRPRNKV